MFLNVNCTVNLFLILLLNVGTHLPSLAFQPLVTGPKRVFFRPTAAAADRSQRYIMVQRAREGEIADSAVLNDVDKAVLNRLLEGEKTAP